MQTAQIELPAKLIPVFDGTADVRGAYGGRGSAKTRSFATMIAVRGYIYGNTGVKGLLLCGRQDAWASPAQHAAMQRLAPAAQLSVVEDAGHMVLMERPKETVQALLDFLAHP